MKKQKSKKERVNTRIYTRFAIFMTGVSFGVAFIVAIFSYFLLTYNLIRFPEDSNRLSSVFFLLLVSAILGTVIPCVLGRRVFKSILDVNVAMQKVSHGDYSVRLKENKHHNRTGNLAANFNLMASELQKTEMLRNDFVVNVSHEFKTPLSAIQNCALLIDDESLTNEERSEYGKMLRESADHLSTLTTNILRISKIENLEILTDVNTFSLDEQIRRSILILEPKWIEKNLELNIELEHCTFKGNLEMINQVFINVIGNAIKFSHENGKLDISLEIIDSVANVKIKDYGSGMDKETQKFIFDKFYQGDSSHKSEGNGLGLALAKRIVALHSGSIEVESEVNKGALFTIKFPLQ